MTDAVVGVSDHGGWAVLVTVARDGGLLDRRRVEAVALVGRVQASAERNSAKVLDALAASVSGRITGIALRHCQELPPTIAERLGNYRARNVADWVMYRRALAAAAGARGCAVRWYDAKSLFANLDTRIPGLRRSLGPPWDKDHQLAMAAAIAFSHRRMSQN